MKTLLLANLFNLRQIWKVYLYVDLLKSVYEMN